MKQLTSYNRAAGYLNKIFDLLNEEYFESTLSRPTITIQSTPKAYGHFSLREDTWVSKLGGTHEINIGAAAQAMPCYPEAGCIAFQDDILVVKLGQVTDTEMNFYQIPD